jgi:hypothetical protein
MAANGFQSRATFGCAAWKGEDEFVLSLVGFFLFLLGKLEDFKK